MTNKEKVLKWKFLGAEPGVNWVTRQPKLEFLEFFFLMVFVIKIPLDNASFNLNVIIF